MNYLRRGGSTRKWRRLRDAVLKRDKYLCVQCRGEGKLVQAAEVDHIIPRHKGGKDRGDNLQSLCGPHHEAKTKQDIGSKDISCDVSGRPLDPSHPWNQAQGRGISKF